MMLATSILLLFVLPLAIQCFGRTIEFDSGITAEKRDVNWHRCTEPYAKDVVHITKWFKEPTVDETTTSLGNDLLHPRSDLTHMLDSRDLQPDIITQELEKRAQDITAQDLIYLGFTGEKDKQGNERLGQVSSVDDAPTFQFLACPGSKFSAYLPEETDDLSVVYGHLALASDTTRCVQPSALSKRHAAIYLKPCPQSEDGKQFLAYFKFTRYERRVDGKTTILSYMEFLGKPNKLSHHFNANYTIQFDPSSKSVFIDGRAPNERMAKGEQSVFSFNNRRKAK